MTDPTIITETDLDERPTVFGHPYTEADLMTFNEWWAEFQANICCSRPSDLCACGGYTDEIPSGISRLLTGEEDC